MYDAEKIYYGIVKTYYPEKESGYIINSEFGAVGFHIRQFIPLRKSIEIREVLKFNLTGSKNYPGQLRANNIKILEIATLREIIKLQRINSDERFSVLSLLLEKEKKKEEYAIVSSLAYELSSPLYKLKLWINKYVTQFDFKLFEENFFRLNRKEAAEVKKYIKLNIANATLEDFRKLGTGNILEIDGRKTIETSWRDIGFGDGKVYLNIGDPDGNLSQFTWRFAKRDFNLIVTGYITKRNLGNTKSIVINNDIIDITGLEELQEAILVADGNRVLNKIGQLIEEGWESKAIRFHPDYINLGNADFLRLFGNNLCIDYLQKIQATRLDMPLIYVIEKNMNMQENSLVRNSFLFTIVLPDEFVSIIWESVITNRATQIFSCHIKDYTRTIREIEEFLTFFGPRKRSTLNGNDEEYKLLRKKLGYYRSVQHTQYDFEKWKRKLHVVITGLPEPLV